MFKLSTLALVGIVTAASVLPSLAQFAANNPGGPNYPSAGDPWDCRNEIGHVRRISADDINRIQDQSVWLYPICEQHSILPTDDYDRLFLEGNVFTLRQPVARNATLMNALRAKGYDQHDVISVVFAAGNSIMLYVHQRDMN